MASSTPTGIGRAVDLRYPSNRFVLFATGVAAAGAGVAGLVSGDGPLDSALLGAAVGAAVFLAWATARELDPDRSWTAGAAAMGAGVLTISGRPSLVQAALLMLSARVLTRSTGLSPTIVDRAVLVVGAGYVASTNGGLGVAGACAVMAAADGLLAAGDRAGVWWTASAVAAASVLGAVLGGAAVPDPAPLDGGDLPGAAVASAAILGLARRPRVTAKADWSPKPLEVGRVWAARLGVAVGAGLSAAWAGGEGIVGLGASWAALAAAGIPGFARSTS